MRALCVWCRDHSLDLSSCALSCVHNQAVVVIVNGNVRSISSFLSRTTVYWAPCLHVLSAYT